jgi:hypothetical protein
MIKLENTVTPSPKQWEAIIRGMRNPMNSWDKSDSYTTYIENPETHNTADFEFFIGDADKELMLKLVKAGSDHSKFMRMIPVYVDVTAPLYWWKEYDTYKVGTVANSCSTMHKIHAKEFTLDDFSHEHLLKTGKECLEQTIRTLNAYRNLYVEDGYKADWDNIIQLLPSSYNQKRTLMLNYAVLRNIYHSRKNHKLQEWHEFCRWIEYLPYSEIIM